MNADEHIYQQAWRPNYLSGDDAVWTTLKLAISTGRWHGYGRLDYRSCFHTFRGALHDGLRRSRVVRLYCSSVIIEDSRLGAGVNDGRLLRGNISGDGFIRLFCHLGGTVRFLRTNHIGYVVDFGGVAVDNGGVLIVGTSFVVWT